MAKSSSTQRKRWAPPSELTAAGSTKHAINMVESGKQRTVRRNHVGSPFLKDNEAVKELIAFQEEIVAAVGKEKQA